MPDNKKKIRYMAHLAAQYVPLEIPELENLMLRKTKKKKKKQAFGGTASAVARDQLGAICTE